MFRQDTSLKTQEETAQKAFWENQPYLDPLAKCQPLKLPKLKTEPQHEDLTQILLWGIYHFRDVRGKLIWNKLSYAGDQPKKTQIKNKIEDLNFSFI